MVVLKDMVSIVFEKSASTISVISFCFMVWQISSPTPIKAAVVECPLRKAEMQSWKSIWIAASFSKTLERKGRTEQFPIVDSWWPEEHSHQWQVTAENACPQRGRQAGYQSGMWALELSFVAAMNILHANINTCNFMKLQKSLNHFLKNIMIHFIHYLNFSKFCVICPCWPIYGWL